MTPQPTQKTLHAKAPRPSRAPLGPEDWLMAGFRALVSAGPNALRAEPLARAMGTTKGSFYWHFKDVADYHARLLAHWQTRAFDDVMAALAPHSSSAARLRHLCRLAVSFAHPAYGGAELEPALRAWARGDARVATCVQHMDARRIAYLEGLCQEAGITEPHAARLLYAATTGLELLDAPSPEQKLATIDLLLDTLLPGSATASTR
ncbi:MAG: TetR/AcrR family transcriptional regulator [Pararhodobacter sp.]